MLFSSHLRTAKKDGVAVPFAAAPLFLFPFEMQVRRAADNHQAKHDG
jgi:hypothetical protein